MEEGTVEEGTSEGVEAGWDNDYEVISLQLHWASFSILFFLLTLPAEYLLGFLPWRPQRIWLWPLVPPLVILGLSILGFACGWIGYRFSDKKRTARVGMFLNGVVLAIVLSMVAVWLYIVAGR